MDTHAGFSDRNITLSFEFAKSIIDDPAILDEIPEGATLVLLPENEPDLAKENLRLGLEAAERGENVYIRHVKNLSSAMPQSP
jgi:hypothetical protein